MRLRIEQILLITTIALFFTSVAIVFVKDAKIEKLKSRIKELETQITISELKAQAYISDIRVLEERRIILDSLHQTNIKNRNDEKINLIQSASDSTIKRIVLRYISAK